MQVGSSLDQKTQGPLYPTPTARAHGPNIYCACIPVDHVQETQAPLDLPHLGLTDPVPTMQVGPTTLAIRPGTHHTPQHPLPGLTELVPTKQACPVTWAKRLKPSGSPTPGAHKFYTHLTEGLKVLDHTTQAPLKPPPLVLMDPTLNMQVGPKTWTR